MFKKTKTIVLIWLIGLMVIFAQGAFAWEIPNGLPFYVTQSLEDAPKDALVSIGFSAITDSIALGNAMVDILDKCNSMIQDIVRNYAVTNEVDPSAALSYLENIALSISQINGLTINTMRSEYSVTPELTGLTINNSTECWAIVILDNTSLLIGLKKAAASAKEAVPAMAALDFETRIDDEFNKLISQELRILDYDNSIRDLLISDSLEGEWEGDERRRLTIPFDAERRLNEAFGK